MEETIFKVINIIMSKGGVGKTTVTAFLAYELCKYGKVLIIDGDQQGNISTLFSDKDEEEDDNSEQKSENNDTKKPLYEKEFFDVLTKIHTLEETIVEVRKPKENFNGLYLLPTNKGNTRFKSYLDSYFGTDASSYSDLLNDIKNLGYNYVFVDLPTNWSNGEKIMISKSDLIIPIINTDEFTVDSLQSYWNNVQKIRKTYCSKQNQSKSLIVNKYDKRQPVQTEYLEYLKTTDFDLFTINYSATVNSAISRHKVIQEQLPNCEIAKNIAVFAENIIK